MGVTNNQLANQDTFNAAFVSRNSDTDTSGKLDLQNTDTVSGADVTNLQREVNSLNSFTGHTAGTAKDVKPTWTGVDNFVTTDDVKTRVDVLSTLMDKDTGHSHDGSNKGGAQIEGVSLKSTTANNKDVLQSDGAGAANWVVPPHGFNIPTAAATIANNQSSAANVTGMDCSAYQSVTFYLQLTRKTDSTEKTVSGTLTCFKRFNSSAWVIVPDLKGDGDSDGGDTKDGAGVTFSITTAGQVKYVSDNMSTGSGYTGTLTFRGMTFN